MSIPRAAHARGLFFFRFQTWARTHPCLSSPCKNAPRRGYAERACQVSAKGRPPFVNSVGIITTLNPDKISSKDYLVISQAAGQVLQTSAKAIRTQTGGGKKLIFASDRVSLRPKDSPFNLSLNKSGFLYYHQEIAENPISGGLRFRLADHPSIAAFHAGKDLSGPFSRYDLPWRLPLLQIVNSPNLAPLLAQLRQDGLVTDETVRKCRQIHESNRPLRLAGWGIQIIYRFDEPFIVNFDEKAQTIHFLDPDLGRLWTVLSFQVANYPWKGKCLVRFEEVTSRSSNTAKPPFKIVKLRVVKILEPFRWRESSVYLAKGELPKEGSLLLDRGLRLVDQCRGGRKKDPSI